MSLSASQCLHRSSYRIANIMNQLGAFFSKLGFGGSSQDEGKAASKHPDAEA